jgi:hypothetical protein
MVTLKIRSEDCYSPLGRLCNYLPLSAAFQLSDLFYRTIPPGYFYEIYAVEPTVALLSRFFNLRSLHLTEMSRRFDVIFESDPPQTSVYLTLVRMLNGLIVFESGLCRLFSFFSDLTFSLL